MSFSVNSELNFHESYKHCILLTGEIDEIVNFFVFVTISNVCAKSCSVVEKKFSSRSSWCAEIVHGFSTFVKNCVYN